MPSIHASDASREPIRRVGKFQSKKQVVHNSLRLAILHGDLQPGSRLVIDEIAHQLDVSPIPVREALQQLQADGLVSIEPYVGTTVSGVHPGMILEVFELLQAMELISLRAVCHRMHDADLDQIETMLHQLDAHVADPDDFSAGNMRLHLFICERADMPLVKSMLFKVFDHWDRLRRHFLNDLYAARCPVAQQEHWQLLEALRRRDPDLLERLTREHNQNARVACADYLESAQSKGDAPCESASEP